MNRKLFVFFAVLSLCSLLHGTDASAQESAAGEWVPDYLMSPHINQTALDGTEVISRGNLDGTAYPKLFEEKDHRYIYKKGNDTFSAIENENLNGVSHDNQLNTCGVPSVDSQNYLHLCLVEPIVSFGTRSLYRTNFQAHYKINLGKVDASDFLGRLKDGSTNLQLRLMMTKLRDNWEYLGSGKNNHHKFLSCTKDFDTEELTCPGEGEAEISEKDVQVRVAGQSNFISLSKYLNPGSTDTALDKILSKFSRSNSGITGTQKNSAH